MTTVRYWPQDLRVRIEGHAGAGEPGGDPVCAAVSALAWTLVRAVSDDDGLRPSIFMEPEQGVMDISCEPEEDLLEACRAIYGVITCGLSLIAEHEPEFVRFERVEEGGRSPRI